MKHLNVYRLNKKFENKKTLLTPKVDTKEDSLETNIIINLTSLIAQKNVVTFEFQKISQR